MTTGQDLLNSALKAHWKPYSIAGGRCDPLRSGYADCSGLMSFAMNDNGLYGGCGNSTGIELWATSHGGVYVTRAFAAGHPGVMLAKWGYSADGHIKMSTGDGRSFGTPSDECHCAGYERFDARGVDRYFTVPGVAYGPVAPPAPPAPKGQELTMFNIKTNVADPGYWIKDGVRITPAQAFFYGSKGVAWSSFLEIEFERGLAGENPGTGQVDYELAPRIVDHLQGGQAAAALATAGRAEAYAAQADNRVKALLDHFGIADA